MSTPIRIKRSAVPGKRPTVNDLQLGELAVNTYDGALYSKRFRPGVGTDIIEFGGGFPIVTNLIYVTADGSDSNSGLKLGDAKATIKAAVGIATAGSVIKVSAGRYIEDNPIELPDQVSVVGDSLREVDVQPQNIDEDLFYVGNGCYIAEMSFTIPTGSVSNGAAVVAFNPNNQVYINQSPYIQNCTNFIPGSIGLKVDGQHALGPLKSMVLDSYTQYNQGGIGASMTNEGYAQLVSLFTICDDIAVYCGTGGGCDLTNSNSSFGNYGLVANGTSPLKYTGIVTQFAESNSFEFALDLNTPTLNITNASYDNISGIFTAYTSIPHEFSVGMGVSLAGIGFTFNYNGQSVYISWPFGEEESVYEIKTVAPGRYVDASNLIDANRTEIIDKSLAAIALNYPDFVFPGDSANDASYRYKDSYRLIQQNKQEIIDKSLASIAVGFSTFYFPGDTQTNARSRYYDAYRLIQENKTEIVNTAWTNTVTAYPGISITQVKCKRDIGYFVDAISTDVFTGGNNYARQFTLQYFDAVGSPIPNGLVGVTTESIYAFQQARNLMKNAITNQLTYKEIGISSGPRRFGSGSPFPVANTSPLACSDVQDNIDNLVGIVTTVIGAGNTSGLSATPNLGISTTNKCARDLGYFVDAISTDLFTGGNSYVIGFVEQYFDAVGAATSALLNEESQSIYAFHSARDYAKKAITNQLNVKDLTITADPNPGIGTTSNVNPYSCTNVRDTIDTLVGIATQAIGDGNLDYINNNITLNGGTFLTGESKCRRDIGYIVDAVSSDVRNYTNKSIIAATKSYFTSSGTPLSNGLVGVKSESITAFNSVGTYSKLAINNMLNVKDLTLAIDPATGSNTDPLSCANVRTNIDTLVGILTTFVGQENLIGLPSVSLASTVFTMNLGTISEVYNYVPNTGTAKINVVRPFDGQVVYFNDLYYSVGKVIVGSGGTGYTSTPIVTIAEPDTPWGVPATAVATISGGQITGFEMVSNGRGYTTTPTITISSPDIGINTATAIIELLPTYYSILKSTPVSSGITTITINENVPYSVGVGTEVLFYKQSRVLASGHSFEYIGSGTDIANAVPLRGGVPIQDNEADMRNGGLVVYTSTDQSGNFRIGEGVAINQQTGTISGRFYSKSLFSTMTPFILALGGD